MNTHSRRLLSLSMILCAAAPLLAAPKAPKDYRDEIRQDLRKNLSPHMLKEMEGMLDTSPAQEIQLTAQEKQEWSKLLQLNGKTTPKWLEQLRGAPPTTDVKIEDHP